jgi:ethanolamine utilization protein EutQ
MSGLKHFKYGEMRFGTTQVGDQQTAITRLINAELSSTMGAGIERLEKTRLEWTVTYDEVLFIREGELSVVSGGKTHRCRAGDIVWIPNGTTLIYDAPEACEYFYALYPVDWAKRQGIEEP